MEPDRARHGRRRLAFEQPAPRRVDPPADQVAVRGGGEGGRPRPLGVWQAAAFWWANPKGWVFAVALVGTFLPEDLAWIFGVAVLTGTVMAVVVVSASVWAAGGAALGRAMDDDRTRRVVNLALAALLVARSCCCGSDLPSAER